MTDNGENTPMGLRINQNELQGVTKMPDFDRSSHDPLMPGAVSIDDAIKKITGCCVWTQNAPNIWMSSCGQPWLFPAHPAEHNQKFCANCGKKTEFIDQAVNTINPQDLPKYP